MNANDPDEINDDKVYTLQNEAIAGEFVRYVQYYYSELPPTQPPTSKLSECITVLNRKFVHCTLYLTIYFL